MNMREALEERRQLRAELSAIDEELDMTAPSETVCRKCSHTMGLVDADRRALLVEQRRIGHELSLNKINMKLAHDKKNDAVLAKCDVKRQGIAAAGKDPRVYAARAAAAERKLLVAHREIKALKAKLRVCEERISMWSS